MSGVGEWCSPTMKNRKTGEMSEKDRKRKICSRSLALNADVCDPQQHPGTRVKAFTMKHQQRKKPGAF